MPSPRRSTRSALPPSKSQHSDSSTSSLSSVRPERNTRSHLKSTPPQHSVSPLSSEDGADDSHPQKRRSKHPQDVVGHDNEQAEEAMGDDAGSGADITRCICGHQEYPGPPLSEDMKANPDINSEDAGGLFIQCDKCSVWQHGGCVGIFDEDKTPDNYYCEQCEKRLHQVMTDAKGQRYSRYLPLYRTEHKTARKSSVTIEGEARAKREREATSRASADSLAAKRRSTMNSRQAYDEEETLRRVIEESKGENEPGTGSRKGKRVRDESEEIKQEYKRQRTSSVSLETFSNPHTASLDAESDDAGSGSKSTASSMKKARSAAAETQRQKELRERETVKDQQRTEAANRRKDRAGRRRVDESEPKDETSITGSIPKSTPLPTPAQPQSPPAIELQPPSSSHKRGANRKPKRLGRNQYTRDREFPPPASPRLTKTHSHTAHTSSGEEPNAPKAESNSGSNSKNSPSSTNDTNQLSKARGSKWKGKQTKATTAAGDSDGSKDKDKEKSDVTIREMDKNTQYMLEFINKNQGEVVEGRSLLHKAIGTAHAQMQAQEAKKPFDQLSSTEMADELMRQIRQWRGEFTVNALTVS